MPLLRTLGAFPLLVLLASCASAGSSPDDKASPSLHLLSPKPTPPSQIIGRELTGTLGLAEVEGGCPFLEAPDGIRYEVIYPDGWELQRSPLRLLSPTGDAVARPGDEVTVRGMETTDMASICQIGPIFRATEVVSP